MEALKTGRIKYASQDGNREFLTLLASICADGTALPPSLIYKSDSDTLQDTWLEDWQPEEVAYFAVSANGWTCNKLGLSWLEKVFHAHTKQKAGHRRRLLIVDGHSSHVNLQFIEKCDEFRILLLILPPHSTHRLQPLDVSLFSPLSTNYSNGLTKLMFNSLGITSISKRTFWSVFYPAWTQAFSVANIASAFKKTGIWPTNPALQLKMITKPLPSIAPSTPTQVKTPLTCRAVRRIQRKYTSAPSPSLLTKLFRANKQLSMLHSCNQHVIRGLEQALKNEKKKRQRGKRLNLIGKEDAGAQFFGPQEIQAARDYQATKEEEEAQQQQDIINRKALTAANKQQKEKEKLQKAEIAAEKRVAKAAEMQLRTEAKKAVQAQRRRQLMLSKQSTVPTKSHTPQKKQITTSTKPLITAEAKATELVTSRGRRIQRPERFIN